MSVIRNGPIVCTSCQATFALLPREVQGIGYDEETDTVVDFWWGTCPDCHAQVLVTKVPVRWANTPAYKDSFRASYHFSTTLQRLLAEGRDFESIRPEEFPPVAQQAAKFGLWRRNGMICTEDGVTPVEPLLEPVG